MSSGPEGLSPVDTSIVELKGKYSDEKETQYMKKKRNTSEQSVEHEKLSN